MPAPGRRSDLDRHFGPQVMFHQKRRARSRAKTSRPAIGLQFFGHVAIDGASEVMTVTLKDVDDRALWSIALDPSPARHDAAR